MDLHAFRRLDAGELASRLSAVAPHQYKAKSSTEDAHSDQSGDGTSLGSGCSPGSYRGYRAFCSTAHPIVG